MLFFHSSVAMTNEEKMHPKQNQYVPAAPSAPLSRCHSFGSDAVLSPKLRAVDLLDSAVELLSTWIFLSPLECAVSGIRVGAYTVRSTWPLAHPICENRKYLTHKEFFMKHLDKHE